MAFLLEEIKQNKNIFFYKGVDDTVHEKQKKTGRASETTQNLA